jgi:cytochrome c oxidase subunit 2
MITWNRFFFNSPSTYLIELVVSIHDYVILFLFSVLFMVLVIMLNRVVTSNFNFEFFENHQLENLWTVAPFLILLFIVIPSLNSLYILDSCFYCGITVRIVGHQWYWTYNYKDIKNLCFDCYILPSNTTDIRLLDVDNRIIIPTFLPIRFIVTSADVIHSWTIPSFGVKIDAVPGRINQFCFSTKRSGVFFGQCSEICGANHSFMPIVIESVNFKDFTKNLLVGSLYYKALSF